MSVVLEEICKHLQADIGAGGVMTIATAVYPKIAPEGAVHPYVIVTAISPPRGSYTFGGLSQESSEYLAKAVDKNVDPSRAADLSKAVRARLHDAALTITGYSLMYLRWERDIDYPEVDGDTIYHHEGPIVRVEVQPQ